MLGDVYKRQVLTLTAPATLPVENAPVASLNLQVRATNMVGRGDQNVSVDITHLTLPRLQRLPSQNVNRDEVDTFNLASFATGMPQVFFALGTIQPTLTEAVATITSNANGMWTIRPNPQLETLTSTFNVNVIASNRVGTTNGAFQLVVHGVPHTDPAIAPVWGDTGLNYDVNTGGSVTINLLNLITRSRPQPTFTVSSASDITDLGGTATIAGNILTISIPSAIDEDVSGREVHVTARNSAGATDQSFTVNIHHVNEPVWQTIPAQTWHNSVANTLDLNQYVTATPDVTSIAFQSAYTKPSWMSLSNGILSGTPTGIAEDTSINVLLEATNAEGTTRYTLPVNLLSEVAPAWEETPVVFEIVETRTATFNLAPFLSAGVPTPTLSLTTGTLQQRLNVSISGLDITIADAPQVDIDTDYALSLTATNASGSADLTITVRVLSQVSLTEGFTLNAEDFDEIRSLIDYELTADNLPDAVIARDVFAGEAVDWVIGQLVTTGVTPRTPQNILRHKRAAIYQCAGLIVPSVPQLVSESVGQLREQFDAIDWIEKQNFLFARAGDIVRDANRSQVGIKPSDSTDPKNYAFFIVHNRRGG